MSAYIVEKDCIDRVAGYMARTSRDWADTDQAREIGKRLIRMNYDAVMQRYPKEDLAEVAKMEEENYNWNLRGDLPMQPSMEKMCQWLKSFDCLIYQCSEGNVPESALYQQTAKAREKLARALIQEIPQYKDAKWG